MFKLNLKNLCGSTSYYDGNNSLKFDPPVYEQRYSAVFKVLEHHTWEGTLRKIAEFGCAEMGFFKYLKKVKGVEKIMQVSVRRFHKAAEGALCARDYENRINWPVSLVRAYMR